MINNKVSIKNILSEKDLDLIHDNTIKILENEGIKIENEEALEIFANNGIKTEGNKVYISGKKLEDLIKKIPGSFELKARNSNNDIIIGNDNSLLGPPLGPPFIYEDGDKRYGTYKDYEKLIKYCHKNSYIDLVGGDIIAPTDIDKKKRHKKMFYAAVKYSDKALIGTGSGKKETQDIINMAKSIFGEKELINNNYILKLLGASSPLEYNNTALNTLMNMAKNSQPIAIYSQILAGMTGPITLAGLLTQQNAEILLGSALIQLIKPNTPVIYGSTSSVTDMKSGNITVGNSQYAKIIAAVSQIADYYDIPSMIAGGVTDSKNTDNQAGFETMLNMYTSIESGIDIIIYAVGGIKDYLGISYDKLSKDNAIIKSLINMHNKIEVNENTIARKVIEEIGSGKNFMTHSHTMERLEQRIGEKNTFNKDILNNYTKPKLDNNVDKELNNYLN